MGKKEVAILVLICCIFVGVIYVRSQWIDYSLPKKPIAFKSFSYDDFSAIKYKNKTYIGYATLKNKISKKDVLKCIGYIDNEKNIRVFILTDDTHIHYLMVYDVEGFMEQPMFYRDIETKHKKIKKFNYIDSLDYDYWK